jgi:hypothetical protein
MVFFSSNREDGMVSGGNSSECLGFTLENTNRGGCWGFDFCAEKTKIHNLYVDRLKLCFMDRREENIYVRERKM